MLLVYTPEGEERQEFVFRPLEMNNMDAEDIEDVGGNIWDNFDEFTDAFHQGKTRALRAALWISLRTTSPNLEFDHVGFKRNEINVLLQSDERDRIRQSLHEGILTDEQADEAKRILAAEVTDSEESGKDEPAASDTNST